VRLFSRISAATLFGILLLIPTFARAQEQELTPMERDMLISRVYRTMKANLEQLDNYTCLQTIRRYARKRRNQEFRNQDIVGLQVTVAGKEEYYAWPGFGSEITTNPAELVRHGLSASGMFSGHARSLFVSPRPSSIKLAGKTEWNGKEFWKFDFEFQRTRSSFRLANQHGRAQITYGGSYWADPETFEVRRIEIQSLEAAPEIRVEEVYLEMTWGRVQFSGREILAPQHVALTLYDFGGEASRNEVVVSHCRAFETESSIRFDETPEIDIAENIAKSIQAPALLPQKLRIRISLDETVDLHLARVGDVVTATLRDDVKSRGRVLLPAGSKVQGRIRRLELHREPVVHSVAGIEFSLVEHDGGQYLFLAEMESRGELPNLRDHIEDSATAHSSASRGRTRTESRGFSYVSPPGTGIFIFEGTSSVLPKGYSMTWRTLPPDGGP
jgi:hypothetical protein